MIQGNLQMSKEQELGLQRDRKQFDIREQYFVSARFMYMLFRSPFMLPPKKLNSAAGEDWEPKRIQRPKGLPEWGVPPEEPPQKKP